MRGTTVQSLFLRVAFYAAMLMAVFVCAAEGKPAGKTSRLAKYIPLCSIKDPQLNQCVTNAISSILKYAKPGIPELNIPSLEPFVIPEIDLKVFQGLSSSLFGDSLQKNDKSRAFTRNLVVHHSSEFQINSVNLDLDKKQFTIDLDFPKLITNGEYDVNLILFNLPIKSTGPVHINVTDTSVKATLTGKTIKRKNETYLLYDSINIKVDFKDFTILIENLFKKDQNLNKALNDILRNQKEELRKLTMPMIEELSGKMILNMLNQIMSGLPLEEIFLQD